MEFRALESVWEERGIMLEAKWWRKRSFRSTSSLSYFFKDSRVWEGGAKERYVIPRCHWHLTKRKTKFYQAFIAGNKVSQQRGKWVYPVEDIVRAGVDHLDHNVGVEKVGGDHVGDEGSVFLLEYDAHDVVPYVPLSLQLQQGKSI